MSFDLFVLGEPLEGEDLSEFMPGIRESLAVGCGVMAEWHPEFNWSAPFSSVELPFKVTVDPAFVGNDDRYGGPDATFLTSLRMTCEKGAESIEIAKKSADRPLQARLQSATFCYGFHTSAGRSPLNFLLQSAFASILSLQLGGVLLDPQDNQGYFFGENAIMHMMTQARAYEAYCLKQEPHQFEHAKFSEWPELVVYS